MIHRCLLVCLALSAAVCSSCSRALAQPAGDEEAANARRLADVAAYRAFVAGDVNAPPPTEAEVLAAQCTEDEIAWMRSFVSGCAARCHSDEDCLGYATGDERCRVVAHSPFPEDESPFVDAETAAALDQADALALEEAGTYADDFVSVVPSCDVPPCEPIIVPAPRPAVSVRLCDSLWDLEELARDDASAE